MRAETRIHEDPAGADAWIALADLLHFEMFWLQSTESVYEQVHMRTGA